MLRERGALLALLIVLFAAWAFVELSDEVVDGSTAAADEFVLLLFRSPHDRTDPLGPDWIEETARDVTGLGGVGVLTFITFAMAGFLALQGKRHLAAYVIVAVGTGMVLSVLLKAGFDRPRPDLVPHAQVVYTSSFPSGHSMMSAVTYLTLGALLASAQSSWLLKGYLLGLAALLTVAVGISRVYLGVHWPTDVLGGWAAGAAWALACWTVARYLRRRGRIE
ncbi:MAG: phosphatase PAP2 family protein [Gammaproteobacteria bacterium]|nr:PA-phosphatase [Gammaproteobacteria bacterium]